MQQQETGINVDKHNLHEILLCSECGFRFPLSPTEKRLTNCPRCHAPLIQAEVPYNSFSVPQKEHHAHHPEFISVLDNIRSAYNVGSIFRTSDGAGINKLVLCGITPTPENERVLKTSLGAEKSVNWSHSWSILESIVMLKESGFLIVSLEGGESSVNIFSALPIIKQEQKPIALVVGNEVSGIDPEAVKLSNVCIYIPMEGIKESLNVATAFGIASYLIRYQGMTNE